MLLGKCYYYGTGVKRNFEKAYHLIVKEALIGTSVEAMCLLGNKYWNGQYVEQDRDQGFTLYQKAYESITDQDYIFDRMIGADAAMRLGDINLSCQSDKNCYFYALNNYQTAENLYYKQKTLQYNSADDGIKRAIKGQRKARKKISESYRLCSEKE